MRWLDGSRFDTWEILRAFVTFYNKSMSITGDTGLYADSM
jgi:hypothetical protein